MQVHFHLDNLPAFINPVLTIGTFDGVHSGHLAILKELKQKAAVLKGETITYQSR
jgi:riboflavin kinase/FMN adenylyltransferase